MADEIVYKKMMPKADNSLKEKIITKHGKQTDQKLNLYVALEYLLKYFDENNTKSVFERCGWLLWHRECPVC